MPQPAGQLQSYQLAKISATSCANGISHERIFRFHILHSVLKQNKSALCTAVLIEILPSRNAVPWYFIEITPAQHTFIFSLSSRSLPSPSFILYCTATIFSSRYHRLITLTTITFLVYTRTSAILLPLRISIFDWAARVTGLSRLRYLWARNFHDFSHNGTWNYFHIRSVRRGLTALIILISIFS